MPARRKTLLYAGGLGLAIVGLIVDRALRQAPASASGEPTRPPAGPAAAPPPSAGRTDVTPTPWRSRAGDWLRQLPDVPEVRDVFDANSLGESDPERTAAGENGGPADPVAAFVASHHLGATFRDRENAYAIVNGRIVRIGQTVDGFRLITIDSFRATFTNGRAVAVLALSAANPAVSPDAAARPEKDAPTQDAATKQPAEADPDQ